MLLVIIALYICVAVARESFISLNDHNFDQEDPRIVAELKRRMNHDALIRAFKPRVRAPAPSAHANSSRTTLPPVTQYRRNFGTQTAQDYPKDIVERGSRHKMIEISEQALYGAQYRIRELIPYTAPYLELPEFRISFILQRLETLERELEYIYSYLFNKGQLWQEYAAGSKLTVFTFIVYYQRVLMKNIDVRYMVDHLFSLHGEIEKAKAVVMKQMEGQREQNMTRFNTTSPAG